MFEGTVADTDGFSRSCSVSNVLSVVVGLDVLDSPLARVRHLSNSLFDCVGVVCHWSMGLVGVSCAFECCMSGERGC